MTFVIVVKIKNIKTRVRVWRSPRDDIYSPALSTRMAEASSPRCAYLEEVIQGSRLLVFPARALRVEEEIGAGVAPIWCGDGANRGSVRKG